MPLKGEAGGHALNSHEYFIVDHGISRKIMELYFLISLGTLVHVLKILLYPDEENKQINTKRCGSGSVTSLVFYLHTSCTSLLVFTVTSFSVNLLLLSY